MTWMAIRLELARTKEFPEGSAGRAYLMHVPVDEDGKIDSKERESHVAMATVHRFWANEPDRAGYLIPTSRGWAISYHRGEDDDELLPHLEDHRLVAGNYLTITDPDEIALPFRIVDVTPIEPANPPEGRPQRQYEAPRESS